jgi:putative chitinase
MLAAGVNCVVNPDLLLQLEHAAESAGWFWSANERNALADRGDVTALTRRINGGLTELAARQAFTLAANEPY